MSSSPDDSGRLIRPYSLTRGRTRPSRSDFAMTSQVVAVPQVGQPAELEPEHHAILEVCAAPVSVAELASRTKLPLGVLRILLSDLLDGGYVMVHESQWQRRRPDVHTLRTVLDRIRAL
ncbi:conserved hypothetical protein [Thermobifida fusca YX]|nr:MULTISPECIES: DUF742 domain-containing protein [Thermobifida]AAZ55469.1 conserved hypothetical protein [Thermobifida fusca YX]NLG55841.1 DUF742 domain-containing protein [Rhodococcus sp. (in: high G+C Gram-positive bacteria)]MBO2530865.1 DUF742 domain-containing protein [Thermobifida sp.]MDD6792631.1 DUF742 domain-containing protein [Thermobifida fusca]PPS91935.1 hypothetical protein BH05_12570 [Thermobifida fusca]